MSPQAQTKQFPGYGVVYPDGVRGIKIVRTFTQGPSKIVNPDGSVSYTTPPPTIHELHGGGYTYADGRPVDNREHLENITDIKMREKALNWFDHPIKVSQQEEAPIFDPDKIERPEPDYILSNQLPPETDEITQGLNDQIMESSDPIQKPNEVRDLLMSIAGSISSLSETVKEQGKEIAKLKVDTMRPDRKVARKKQGQKMKEKWADPAYREKIRMKRIKNSTEETKTGGE